MPLVAIQTLKVVGALVVLSMSSCSGRVPSCDRIAIGSQLTIEPSCTWPHELRAGALILRDPDDQRARIEISAGPLASYGVTRDPGTALEAIRVQARAMPGAELGRSVSTHVQGSPATVQDWTYPAGSTRMVRRHWVVALKDSLAHVSCLGAGSLPRTCDEVAHSIRPYAAVPQGTKEPL